MEAHETKATKNELLNAYYDGHRVFQDPGSASPASGLRPRRLGWPAKPCPRQPEHVFEGYPSTGDQDLA